MERHSPIYAVLVSLILMMIIVLGSFTPNGLAWGFHLLAYLPVPVRIGLILLATAALIFVFAKFSDPRIERISYSLDKKPYHVLVAIIIFFIICAAIFRVHAPLLGDGFYFVKNFSESLREPAKLDFRNEPLSTFYFYSFIKILNVSTYNGFMNAFLFASVLIGIGFIITVFQITQNIFTHPSARFLSFIFLLVIPYIQLFFGYVETYAVVLLAISLYLLFAILYLKQKLSFMPVAIVFLAMNLAHYLGLMLALSFVYLMALEWKNNGWKSVVKTIGVLAGIVTVLLLIINFDFERLSGRVPHSHFLSLTENNDPAERYSQAYSLLSPAHGIDLFNILFLLGGSSLIFIIVATVRSHFVFHWTKEGGFIFAATVPVIPVLFLLKFDLGMSRDWDVMAPYFFVIALFAVWLFFQAKIAHSSRFLSTLLVMMALNTTAFLAVNSNRDASIRRFESLANRQTFSQFGYYSSSLTLASYCHEIDDIQKPVKIWERYVDEFPDDPKGFRNIITNLQELAPDSMERTNETFERWIAIAPGDSTLVAEYVFFCVEAGNFKFRNGILSDAAVYYHRALRFAPTYNRAWNNLGSVYAQEGKIDSAIICFQKAIELNPQYSDPYFNLGNIQEVRGNLKKARDLFIKAAELQNPAATEKLKQLKSKH